MRLVAFSEKPLCLIDVLTATMRADGVSPGLDCIISILCSSEYGMRVKSSNFSSYHSDMGSPPIDLFATSLNYKL
jgi:hypothetical protein